MSEPKLETPRLCHVIKSPKFDGYGFNLHAEKSKPGQYIGKVDEGSPAETAGLRQGDRILEVNGVDIANEIHKQVVERIKQNPNETKLLVASPAQPSTNSLPNLEESNKEIVENNKSESIHKTSNDINDTIDSDQVVVDGNKLTTKTTELSTTVPVIDNNNIIPPTHNMVNENNHNNLENGSIALKLKMTASEFRAHLANKKKFDPKKESIDFKKKFDIVQKL